MARRYGRWPSLAPEKQSLETDNRHTPSHRQPPRPLGSDVPFRRSDRYDTEKHDVSIQPGGGEQVSVDSSEGRQGNGDRHHPGKYTQQLFSERLEQKNSCQIIDLC